MGKEKLPQFMVDELEKYENVIYKYNKDKMLLIHDIHRSYKHGDLPINIDNWLINDENKNKLIRALANGYEVEKEKVED